MQLLEDLLVNSYDGDYTRIINVITAFLKQYTDAKIILQRVASAKANIIALFGNPRLVINCHMDTVPPGDGWQTEPTRLSIKGKRLYGLGTADTKGNIYALLKAVQSVQPRNLILLFSVDEEQDGTTGVEYFLTSDYAKGIKAAVVCEPTMLKFVNKHQGYYCFALQVHTDSGHSSRGSAANAIAEAAELVCAFHRRGYNIGAIEGGGLGNVVPERCSFKISRRSYDQYEEILTQIKEIASNNQHTLKPLFIGNPLFESSPSFIPASHEVKFWTEAALFQKAGIEAVVFGAGDIRQAHSSNEFVLAAELQTAQKTFERIIGHQQ